MNIVDLFRKIGPTAIPLLFVSILSLSVIIERLWFWFKVLTQEKEVVNRILDASRRDWELATEIARQSYEQPIGRFLYAALQLRDPDPELFRLALESTADDEVTSMRRGDKMLELAIAVAPLLGLAGTVFGLIKTLSGIQIGDIGTASTAGVTDGIGEALYSTAVGMVVAIVSLIFYRFFQALVFNQARIFRRSGNEMEILYRQKWQPENPKKFPPTDTLNSASEVPSEVSSEAPVDPYQA